MNLDRTIAAAIRRLHYRIDARCEHAHRALANESRENAAWLVQRLNFISRSYGQRRRHERKS